ncbi:MULTISPECIES: TetR/AcrR family transcriptional regulator [Protofrankia]|uniref:TetR/AcrR family transcriptional regulator n=1 Tax=Protofrankia TaxID=2994361 RepID=UPI00192A85A5|nr:MULTISPECIES: TetR/AcrR family transcriptional regulator [Protofrankia]
MVDAAQDAGRRGGGTAVAGVRKRDPNRRQSIIDATAELLARRGYGGVSMAEIGAEVGIAASAIYWHFPSKQDLLVELFDQCLDRLRAEQVGAVERLGRTREALIEIARLQVEFVVRQRAFARVYYQEERNLRDADLVRLRGKQRAYVETWTDLLLSLRPDLDPVSAECLVHATIGAVQSSLVYNSSLPPEVLADTLTAIALQVLDSPLTR